MKKIILISTMLLTLLISAQAQPPKEPKDKIDALKIAFITKRLDLTEEEAQKFWPVYNKYEAEKDALRESTTGQYKDEKKPVDQMTDAEADKMINDFVAFRSKDVDLMKKYVVEFKKVLPIKKVALLITAEEHFKKMLMKQAQNDGEPGPKPHPQNKPGKTPGGE
jgi:hypothetical protein